MAYHYKKTDKSNIYDKVLEEDTTLTYWEKKKDEIEEKIANLPKPKDKPDKETLEHWNLTFADPSVKEKLEEELKCIEDEIKKINAAK